jgi:hypothetical protein
MEYMEYMEHIIQSYPIQCWTYGGNIIVELTSQIATRETASDQATDPNVNGEAPWPAQAMRIRWTLGKNLVICGNPWQPKFSECYCEYILKLYYVYLYVNRMNELSIN